MENRHLLMLLAMILLAVFSVFAGTITGPGVAFQIKWHVENIEGTVYRLSIKDYLRTSDALPDGYTFNLAYTSDWQGLCTLEFFTNDRRNHGIEVLFTPLKAEGYDSLGFDVKYILGEASIPYKSNGVWHYADEQSELVKTGEFSVAANGIGAGTGTITFLAQHPTDVNRPNVTFIMPISVKLTSFNPVNDVTYTSDISITVVSP